VDATKVKARRAKSKTVTRKMEERREEKIKR
jgi:hypothetical protein